jgi:hypothetical protein
MKHLPLRECGAAIAVVVALLGAYGGAYWATIDGVEIQRGVAKYRLPREFAESLFAPAHELDRQLRVDYWKENYMRADIERRLSRFQCGGK